VITARDNNRVYLEPANKRPLAQKEAEEKYEIDRGKGRNYVETDVSEDRIKWKMNPRYHVEEMTVVGDLQLKNPLFIKRK